MEMRKKKIKQKNEKKKRKKYNRKKEKTSKEKKNEKKGKGHQKPRKKTKAPEKEKKVVILSCSYFFSLKSIHKINYLIPQTEVLIIDEVHQFTSKQSIAVMKSFENAVIRLGFSATPWKEGDDEQVTRKKINKKVNKKRKINSTTELVEKKTQRILESLEL